MNEGKPELGYLLEFPTAVEAFARVKMLGAAKYERGNWKKGGKPDNEYVDACFRHLMAFVNGETFAKDSGCPHLAHAAWNLFALMELNYKGVTHHPELFNKMMKEWTEKKSDAAVDQNKAVNEGYAPILSEEEIAEILEINKPPCSPVLWSKEISDRLKEISLKLEETKVPDTAPLPTVFDSRRPYGDRWYHAEPWAQDEFDRALNREEKNDTK